MSNQIIQYALLLIGAASAGATYVLPSAVVAVGVAALLAFAVERYVSFKEQDYTEMIRQTASDQVGEQIDQFHKRLDDVEDNATHAASVADRLATKEGLGG